MKELRDLRGMSQSQLARQMTDLGFRMHQSSIAKIESAKPDDRRPIRLSEALAIAEIFGEEMDDMLFGAIGAAEPRLQELQQRLEEARAAADQAYRQSLEVEREFREERVRLVRIQRGSARPTPPAEPAAATSDDAGPNKDDERDPPAAPPREDPLTPAGPATDETPPR
jgi:transcriptional regulator with XRE-family HTH domain